MNLQEIFSRLNENKEWIFSGIGIFIICLIGKYLFQRKKELETQSHKKQENIRSNHNIQIGDNAQINRLVIAPKSEKTTSHKKISYPSEKHKRDGPLYIDSPNDGELIETMSGERIPIIRLVKGHILGYSEKRIIESKFRVEVTILTDKWYPQGITKVNQNGEWELEVHYGGLHHTIMAVLMDKANHEIDEKTCSVTLHQ